jgi:hypothetical protein
MSSISIIISILAFLLSATVAWLSLFRRGTLKMTKPSFIAFAYDVDPDSKPSAKIFIRSLLYSTGKRGHVVENMYLLVRKDDKQLPFNIWGYGEEKLLRGSGLFVGETGISTNHHFILTDPSLFEYSSGRYNIQIYATVPGYRNPIQLNSIDLEIEGKILPLHPTVNMSVWFDLQPDKRNYNCSVKLGKKVPV